MTTCQEVLPTSRDLVVRALSLRPAATPSELVRMTGCAASSVDHAIRMLVKAGEVREDRQGAGPQYWLRDSAEGPAFGLHGAPLRFLNAVHGLGGGTLRDVARHLDISVAEASRLGKQLADRGFVSTVRLGRELCFLAGLPRT